MSEAEKRAAVDYSVELLAGSQGKLLEAISDAVGPQKAVPIYNAIIGVIEARFDLDKVERG